MENSKVQFAPGLLWILLIAIIATLLIWAAILAANSFDKKGNQDPLESFSETENIPQTNNQQNAVVNAVGKTRTLYKFADYSNGKVSVPVLSDAKFFPQGGKMKVLTPSGKIYFSEPGISRLRDAENPGIFTFSSADKNAWGVIISQ